MTCVMNAMFMICVINVKRKSEENSSADSANCKMC